MRNLWLLPIVCILSCSVAPDFTSGFTIADTAWRTLVEPAPSGNSSHGAVRNVVSGMQGLVGQRHSPFRGWAVCRVAVRPGTEADGLNPKSSHVGDSYTVSVFVRIHNINITEGNFSLAIYHDGFRVVHSFVPSAAVSLANVAVGDHSLQVAVLYPNGTESGARGLCDYSLGQNSTQTLIGPSHLISGIDPFLAGRSLLQGRQSLWPYPADAPRWRALDAHSPYQTEQTLGTAELKIVHPREGMVLQYGILVATYEISLQCSQSHIPKTPEERRQILSSGFDTSVFFDGMSMHTDQSDFVSFALEDVEPGEHELTVMLDVPTGWVGKSVVTVKFTVYNEVWVGLAKMAMNMPRFTLPDLDSVRIVSPKVFAEYTQGDVVDIHYQINGFSQFSTDLHIHLYVEGRSPGGLSSMGWKNLATHEQDLKIGDHFQEFGHKFAGTFEIAECGPGFHKAVVALVHGSDEVVLSSAWIIWEIHEQWPAPEKYDGPIVAHFSDAVRSELTTGGVALPNVSLDMLDIMNMVRLFERQPSPDAGMSEDQFSDEPINDSPPLTEYHALGNLELRHLGILKRVSGAPLVPHRPDGSRRDLLLGAQDNLNETDVRTWMSSLRESGCDAAVVLFSGQWTPRMEDWSIQFGVTLIHYDAGSLFWIMGVVGNHRFSLYRDLCWLFAGQFHRIMATDVRDVFFQKDPFRYIPVNGGFATFLEPGSTRIGDCKAHKTWLHDETVVYEHHGVYQRLSPYHRSCSGVSIGTSDAMLRYFWRMAEELQRTVLLSIEHVGLALRFTPDQGPHNFLVWGGSLALWTNVTVYQNEDGPLLTMQEVFSYFVNDDGEVLDATGRVIPVLHQFDRHMERLSNARALHGGPDIMRWEELQYDF